MDDLLKRVAALERNQNSGQRRAFNVRINGEEHSATARNGIANILFPIDGQGMTFSECMFKIIFNDGIKGVPTPTNDPCTNWSKGTMLYPTLDSWKARYPIGSAVNVDCTYGTTCWDYACAFWWAQVNRALLTGNGMAWGTISPIMRQTNLGVEFMLIDEWTKIRPGDWVVWGNVGTGHIAMAMGTPEYSWSKIEFWQQSGEGKDTGKPIFSQFLGSSIGGGNTFKGAFRLKEWSQGGSVIA